MLSYAGGNDDFPNDPTHDQWFDHEQYMNYRLLGRAVGDAVKRRIDGSSLWAAAHEAPAPRPEPAPADPT